MLCFTLVPLPPGGLQKSINAASISHIAKIANDMKKNKYLTQSIQTLCDKKPCVPGLLLQIREVLNKVDEPNKTHFQPLFCNAYSLDWAHIV